MSGRFTDEELRQRWRQMEMARRDWSGPYPWRHCQGCYAQIHVGGRSYCDACVAWFNAPPSESRSGVLGRIEPMVPKWKFLRMPSSEIRSHLLVLGAFLLGALGMLGAWQPWR